MLMRLLDARAPGGACAACASAGSERTSADRSRRLPTSPCAAVADPFLWQRKDDGLYMFYETKSTARGRGEIGVARSTDGGVSFKHLGTALSERWHLSYPFVFEHQGQVRAWGVLCSAHCTALPPCLCGCCSVSSSQT